METMHRIRFITENYEALQGLRIVPIWTGLLFVSLLRLAFPDGGIIRSFLILFSLVFAIIMTVWVDGYYKRYFGTVKRHGSKVSIWLNWIVVVFFAAMFVDVFLQLPISILALIAALFMAYLWHVSRGLLPHYPILAILFGLIAIMPIFLPTETRYDAMQLLVGIIFVFTGILDHRMLESSLHPHKDDDDDDTI